MLADTVNILCAPYSRQSCIFLSAGTGGVCFHTIFPNGRPFTGNASAEEMIDFASLKLLLNHVEY